jgi:arginase family enzyme
VNPVPIDPSTPAHELVGAVPRTFFGSPVERDLDALDAQVAFLGVPYDGGTPQPGNRTGQAAGLTAARLESLEQLDYDPSGSTARVATWLITHFLSEIFEQPR